MNNNNKSSAIELIGSPCGHHGPYTFYKAFKYKKYERERIISLCDFFFVKLWTDSDLVCIGELQLLWLDKNSSEQKMLASLRLYFLPENTPEGRLHHGEDEVLAINEKVVLRLEDLLTWITEDNTEWTWGRLAIWERNVVPPEVEEEENNKAPTPLTESLDFSDILKEKQILLYNDDDGDDDDDDDCSIIVLSYSRYCRYRALMKRLEGVEDKWLKCCLVRALGGFSAPTKNTRVLFCRDTFDYPDLEGHELLCNHLAPKWKGRPSKPKKRTLSSGDGSEESSERSVSPSPPPTIYAGRNRLRCNNIITTSTTKRSSSSNVKEQDFLQKLYTFMKSHETPIGRIPSVGYREIDLYALFSKVQKLGGYESCTANRMWKPIYDELGGNRNSTSAATMMRRHYERLLLAFERHIKGKENKSLLKSERRRRRLAIISQDEKCTGNSTTITTATINSITTATPTITTTTTTTTELGKTSSSLRSVRVKPERQKDKLPPAPPSNVLVPVQTAVTPVVLFNKNVMPEKSISPLEGKENNTVIHFQETTRTTSTSTSTGTSVKDKRNVDSSSEQSDLNIFNVKKRKLDILRECGLEVTAISDNKRPSTFLQQQQEEKERTNSSNLSITITSDVEAAGPKQVMYTPSIDVRLIEENVASCSPPKVLQSRSIYSYSERTIYGNPKDDSMVLQHNDKCSIKPVRQQLEEVLDLTVKSPPKQEDAVPFTTTTRNYQLKLVDTRIGSNLEITLVNNNDDAAASLNNVMWRKPPSSSSTFSRSATAHHPKILLSESQQQQQQPNQSNLFLFPKSIQPPLVSMFDPLYYSTLYGQHLFAPPPPPPPLPSVVYSPQLQQFYKDLMAQSSAAAAAASLTSINNHNQTYDGVNK